MTATQTQYTVDEITRLSRRRRELAQAVQDYREDFAAMQNEVRQQAQALSDLANPRAELEAIKARNRLRQVGIALAEAEEEYKAFCEVHPTQQEFDSMLAERQRADARGAQEKAKNQFFTVHDELLALLAQVEQKSSELDLLLNTAPPGTFREVQTAQELCRPLALWLQYKTAPGGSPIDHMRGARGRL